MTIAEIPFGDVGRYFEHDSTLHVPFDAAPVAEKIVAAYRSAVKKAARSARYAISHSTKEHMAEAKWDEAVCQTLEQVLCLFEIADCATDGTRSSDVFDAPEYFAADT